MADLFVAGIATIIQAIGFWRFGVRLPLMQGVHVRRRRPDDHRSAPNHGITAIYGSVIACGLFMMLLAPVFAQADPVLPAAGHRHRSS